jgi:hypothetical protein
MDQKIKIKLEERLHKRNNLVTIIIVIFSGIAGSLYHLNNFISIILLFIGILVIIIFVQGLLSVEKQIRRLINDL